MDATQHPTTDMSEPVSAGLATAAPVEVVDLERIRADYASVKKLGNWTTARHFAIRARRGYVVLDLRSPRIPTGDIDITVNLERTVLKLLLPVDAAVDDYEVDWTGRGRLKDHQARPDQPPARTVRISGQIRHGEIRVNREGIAILSAMLSNEYLRDALRAHREGTVPTVDDPTRDESARW